MVNKDNEGLSSEPFIHYYGLQIRLARVRLGYSQSKLAKLSGMHRTYISCVERGEINISLANCLKISSALDLRLSDIIRCAEEEQIVECSISLPSNPNVMPDR